MPDETIAADRAWELLGRIHNVLAEYLSEDEIYPDGREPETLEGDADVLAAAIRLLAERHALCDTTEQAPVSTEAGLLPS